MPLQTGRRALTVNSLGPNPLHLTCSVATTTMPPLRSLASLFSINHRGIGNFVKIAHNVQVWLVTAHKFAVNGQFRVC